MSSAQDLQQAWLGPSRRLRIERREGGWALICKDEVLANCATEAEATAILRQCAAGLGSDVGPGHVLVIDDDPILRCMASEYLVEAGYSVEALEDGEGAVAAIAARAPDAVVLDMLMPNKDGIETLRELKRAFPTLRVLAISGGGRIEAADLLHWAQICGADAVMRKPLTEESLVEAVRALCDLAPVAA